MATIHDVARHAGVSIATVSRALRDGEAVAPDTRARVVRAVERLGYAPNAAGRHLRTTRSHRLLVTVPDIANPFFSVILHGIEEAARRRGYALLLGDVRDVRDVRDDRVGEARYGGMLRRQEAEGWILVGHEPPAEAEEIVRAAQPRLAPIVSVCQFHEGSLIPSVHIDNARAAADAIDHLWLLGHRRIALITGPSDNPCNRDRVRGAERRARELGVTLTCSTGDFSLTSGRRAAIEQLTSSDRATALFCFNDEMAFGAIDAARRLNLRVPHDISVMGFDDIRLAREVDPPLTTIAQPGGEIGDACVQMLLDVLEGRAASQTLRVLPHRLVVRETTAPPADASTT